MGKKRILVADDEGINRMFLKSLLENNGWEVSEASEGDEAVELTSKNEYKIVLMDVNMPNTDGYQATRRIREKGITGSDGKHLVILALSAYNDPEFFEECTQMGMDGIITKPITEQKLLRKLASFEPASEE